jgi:replicative DNA helicase
MPQRDSQLIAVVGEDLRVVCAARNGNVGHAVVEQVFRSQLGISVDEYTVGGLPLSITDSGGIDIDRLIWFATRKVKQAKIQLMAVDYAQIIRAPGRDERQVVTEVVQRLRNFAKGHNVATLLLSQSPRPDGRAINAKPNMFSLKESGALEEAAHTVILPYRPVDSENGGVFTGEDELIIAKQRAGSIGSIPVYLNGRYLRFEERQSCGR